MQFLLTMSCLLLASTPAQAVSNRRVDAGVNEVVPGSAWAVLALRDPAAVDEKLAPLMADRPTPLRLSVLMQAWLGVIDGFDEHGTLAVVALPVGQDTPLSRRLALLVPTTDPTALMTLWSPEVIQPGLYRATVAGRESYVAFRGGYAVIAPEPESLRVFVDSDRSLLDRLSPYLGQGCSGCDALLWVDAATLASGPLLERYAGLLGTNFGLNKAFLDPLRQFRLSVRLDSDGLAVESYLQRAVPVPGSDSVNTTAPLLVGLPQERVVLALGARTARAADHLKAAFKPAIAGLVYLRVIDPARAGDYESALTWLAKWTDGAAVSVTRLDGDDGSLGVTLVMRGSRGVEPVLDGAASVATWLGSEPFLAPGVNAALKRVVRRSAAETIDGVSVDRWSVRFDGDEPEFYAAFKQAVGAEGFLVRLGAVDGQYVVATFGGGSTRFAEAVRAVRSGRAPLIEDTAISTARKRIAADRSMEAFFFADRWTGLVNTMSELMGRPFRYPTSPPSDLPVTLSSEALGLDATLVNLVIPIELLKGWSAAPAKGAGSTGQ